MKIGGSRRPKAARRESEREAQPRSRIVSHGGRGPSTPQSRWSGLSDGEETTAQEGPAQQASPATALDAEEEVPRSGLGLTLPRRRRRPRRPRARHLRSVRPCRRL